jgi:hypothetical protein
MKQLTVISSEAETRRPPHTSGEHMFHRILAAVDAGDVVAHQRMFDRGTSSFTKAIPGTRFTSFDKGYSRSGRPRLRERF